MMQHNVTTTQQGQPSVHSQIPVARYVNVISSKTEPIKVSGENIKTLTPQNRQTITVPSARVISASHPINVNIRRTTGNQQNRSQPIHIITSNQQQQMYQSNNQQHHPPFVDASGDNVFSNGSPSRNFQNYSEGNNSMLYSSNQQQNTNNGLNNYFDSAANVSNQVNVTSSPHQNNLNMSTAGTNNSNHGIGQLISSPGGSTYIIQGSGSESGIVALPLSQATRASPATVSHFRREPKTVHWLMEHFENAEGVSLPRALMYNHYLLHCQEQQLDPVNAASFGKLVRSVFVGLRTRRLGTRGNSKYHYYGIRIKVNSPLNQLQDEIGYIAMRQQPSTHSKNRYKMHDKPQHAEHHPVSQVSITEQVQQQAQQHQQFLGDASQALPDLDPIQFDQKDLPMPDSFTQEDLLILEDLYRDHCANILDVIVNLQFSCMDNLWYTFWRVDVVSDNSQHPTREELEMKLPRQKFIAMCQWPPVQRWIKDSDHMIYQSLVEVLIPDVLRPIPSALTQAIRNFAKGLEASLTTVLNKTEIPKELVRLKIAAVSAFSQTLRRYTSLNHLAQAARAVLNNVAQINQMLSDLNRVDFTNVQEQASWVCQCDDSIVSELETDFKAALSEQRTLEQWADWLEAVVTKVLQPFEGTDKVTRVARQFLLKWCFYSSMVIRDLTLRSAASFGSFHLIRLLYDEYMFYLVEHRVAQATGETTIAVMGDFANIPPKYLSPAELTIPKTELGVTTSSLASPATFIASAPIANVNVTANIKMQEKAPKRTASAALLDAVVAPQIITAASDNLKSEQSSASVVGGGGNKVSTIGGMITIKTPRTDTT